MSIEIKLKGRTFELPNDIDIMGEPSDERVIKLNLSREGSSEGIWMVIHEKDLEDYENNVTDEDYIRVGALSNWAVCGIPWGAYVPYKLQGENRPIAIFEDIIDPENDDVFFPVEVLERYQQEEADDADTEE